MGLCLFEGALLHLFSCCRVGGWRSCACVSLRGINPFIPACAVGSGWFAHAREGEGGGCALHPRAWPPHHATIRDRPHLHRLHCSRPPLCRAHCPLIPCGTHAFTTAFRHSQCTLACTECNARMASSSFAPSNCLPSALHGDSTSPSLHLLHPANVGCTHSRAPYQLHAPLMFENMCAPPHHKALPCQQSHGLTPAHPHHPLPLMLREVTRWGHS